MDNLLPWIEPAWYPEPCEVDDEREVAPPSKESIVLVLVVDPLVCEEPPLSMRMALEEPPNSSMSNCSDSFDRYVPLRRWKCCTKLSMRARHASKEPRSLKMRMKDASSSSMSIVKLVNDTKVELCFE